jgi:hypothetical protein
MESQPPHQFMDSSDKWSRSRINSWLRLKTDELYPVSFSTFYTFVSVFFEKKNLETGRDMGRELAGAGRKRERLDPTRITGIPYLGGMNLYYTQIVKYGISPTYNISVRHKS